MSQNATFTSDWFSHNISQWEQTLQPLKGQASLQALEIGVYEGRSVLWLLENILTHSTAHLTCIDIFDASEEYKHSNLFEVFQANIKPYADKVTVYKNTSVDTLGQLRWGVSAVLPPPQRSVYDLIYIDGSHKAPDVLEDLVLSWPMLKSGGILIMDDWGSETAGVKQAATGFFNCRPLEAAVLFNGYQLGIKKL